MTDPYAYFYDNKVSNRKGTASPLQSPQQPQDIWYSGGNAATTGETAGATEFGGTQQQSFFNGQIDPKNAPSPPNQQPFYPNYFAGQQQQQQQPNLFIPSMPSQEVKGFDSEFDDIANEPPLLEELGVNFQHIWLKTMAVLNPLGIASAEVIADQDLAGPLVFCLLFGASLLLHGKGWLGYIVVALAVFWSGSASSKLFSIALSMNGQRLLVAYPCTLLYSVFALLAIF
ncbi:hypothetical protein niasHT_019167 [Heterodera trifolii]|uniref:Protein YIPF n=1 Tax=Heterodera trifolii TaxID=157864 RepID=A0ABD2LCN2_9BILA